MNEVERILSAAGDAGAVIVLVLSAVGIVWMLKGAFVEAMRLWRDAAKERNAIDEKRNAIDEKVADTLVSVTDTLERLQSDTHDTNILVTGLRRAQTDHNASAIERHDAVMSRLDGYGEQIDQLLKKIEVYVFPPEVRGDITKLIELITTVGKDVKKLRPPTGDVSESAARAAQSKTKTGTDVAVIKATDVPPTAQETKTNEDKPDGN